MRQAVPLGAVLLGLVLLVLLLLPLDAPTPPSPPEAVGGMAAAPAREPPAAEAPLPAPVDLSAADRESDVFGLVRRPGGAAVGGARVRTFEPLNGFRPFESATDAGCLASRSAGPETRSAVDGSFRLALSSGRLVDLVVTAPGFEPAVLAPVRAGQRVEVTLFEEGAGSRLLVRVVDEAGKDVPGAEVSVVQRDGSVVVACRRGRTDDGGEVFLAGFRPGSVSVLVRHRDHDENLFSAFLPANGSASERVVLASGTRISGTVVDAETERPVAGARVEIWPGGRVAAADGEGRFAFANHSKLLTQVRATAPGYAAAACFVPHDGIVAIRMAPGFTLAGRLVDEWGAPVPNGRVSCRGSAAGDRSERFVWLDLEARAAPDGAFRLEGLRETGTFVVTCEAEGYGRAVLDLDPSGLPREGAVLDAGDVVLARGRTVTGTVRDAEGELLPGVLVMLRYDGEGRSAIGDGVREDYRRVPVSLTSITDDLGRFCMSGVSAGSYLVEACPAGARPARRRVEVPAGVDPVPLDLVVGSGASFTVTVLEPDGRPLPGASVMAGYTGDGCHGFTDASGRIVLTGFPEDVVDLTIDVRPPVGPGRQSCMQTVWTVELARGSAVIRLRPMGWITGTCVDPDGHPLPGVGIRVATRDPGAELAGVSGMADRSGRFELRCAVGGRVALAFEAQPNNPLSGDLYDRVSWRARLWDVTAPQEDLVVVMAPVENDRELQVTALDERGRPLAGATVRAHGVVYSAEGRTGPDGRARLTGVEAGYVHLYVTPAEGTTSALVPVPWREVFDVRERPDAVVVLRPGRLLSGQVRLPDGRPAAGARITGGAGDPDRPGAGVVADEDGRFVVLTASDRKVLLSAVWASPDGEYLLARVEPPAGGAEVILTLGHGER